jgi:hypothetical protein
VTYGAVEYAGGPYGAPEGAAPTAGTFPATVLEVAFATDPAATPLWVDISDRLIAASVNRGRQRELDTFAAGRMTVTLANEDRALDPAYAASPYYPNVVPMRRIRLRSTYAGVTYDVFTGYVDGWTQVYDPPQVATCVVQATDAFKVLANIDLPSSVYAAEVVADAPTHWYRLGEAASVATAVDSGSLPVSGTYTGTLSRAVAGLISRDSDACISITSSNLGGMQTTTPVFPVSLTTFTFEFVLKAADLPPSNLQVLSTGGFNTSVFSVQLNDTNLNITCSTTFTTITYSPVVAGNTYHVVATVTPTEFKVYVNGVLVDTQNGTGPTFAGNPLYVFSVVSPASTDVSVDEVAMYNGVVLSTTRVAAHAAAVATPWNGDTSGTRVGRILDAAGWPSADRSIDSGLAVLQSASLAQAALEALQKVEQTEQGALFVTAGGLVRFIARDSQLKPPYAVPQATFGDAGTELEFGDLTYLYDDSLIYNEVNVSRSGGTVATARDTTSQARYLRRSRTIDGLLYQSDSTSLDLANFVLAHYKDPILRVTGMRLEPAAGNADTHFPQVLGRELMDRVTALRRPQNLGAAITQDTLIEGITHTITAMEWVTSWNLSPAEAQVYWIAGVAGFSEAGVTTRAGF